MRMTRVFRSLCVLAPVVLAVFASAGLRAEEQIAQPASRDPSAEDTDELFARAAERTPKWKNPALGLISSDDSPDSHPKVSAGNPPVGKPDARDNRKDTARDAGGKREARGLTPGSRKAFGKP